MDRTEIAIAGGGVIGLTIALRLASTGREVTLIDPNPPGSGASYGNAGTLAHYAVAPVGTPAVLRDLPNLFLNPDSPLALRLAALPQLTPWLLRFVAQSGERAARRNAEAISSLLRTCLEDWRDVAAEADAKAFFVSAGMLHLFPSHKALDASWSEAVGREHGVRQESLSAPEVRQLEPHLKAEGPGVFFPDAVHVTDPGKLMAHLAAAVEARGVRILRGRITAVDAGPPLRLSGDGVALAADRLVIAAGAFSKPLAAMAGDQVPLETERGYHIEFPMETPRLSRPVSPADVGFYMTPMEGRLRVAGTVELGGLKAPATRRRLDLLRRGAGRYFDGLGEPVDPWLGFRPSLPDSRPVIGPSSASANIIYAFGHGHLGLTLAAVTARLVTGLVNDQADPAALAPFSARRF